MSMLHIGIDIGSTTVKLVLLNHAGQLIDSHYVRHLSNPRGAFAALWASIADKIDAPFTIAISGSGGLSLAEQLDIPFEQEVIACTQAVRHLLPSADVIIELGGEDAKITYLTDGLEQRMNSSCAGGTGAFLDQMASLLKVDTANLNELATASSHTYPIAARCGVFAKTDVQSLLNEGAAKEDIAAAILQAVVNQTIAGLAQGRPIRGKVALLGGPLHFLPQLRERFQRTLALPTENFLISDNGLYFVAIGAALSARAMAPLTCAAFDERLSLSLRADTVDTIRFLPPLFASDEDYKQFISDHNQRQVPSRDLSTYRGAAYLGIDAGSTTAKVALIGEDNALLYTFYGANQGDPLATIRSSLLDLYQRLPAGVKIVSALATGYGEQLVKTAFKLPYGEVETVAHTRAAQFFEPEVDCILDIGGQDMKFIALKNGFVSDIILNEACSSGCGSFLETFAATLGFTAEGFAKQALNAEHPVDLGSRCTVFMNSKVKEAQKCGCSVSDISAGLALSVIKNALFKVIRMREASQLGQHIVVQGGTFLNNAVLRALEQQLGFSVVRPNIAGLMGAFGAALLAKERAKSTSSCELVSLQELQTFAPTVEITRCPNCANHCQLTITHFAGNRKQVSGNRCERGAGLERSAFSQLPNVHAYKLARLFSYRPLAAEAAPRGTIGLPRVLNMYEDYPFWFTFFTQLGYHVELSSPPDPHAQSKSLETISSDSICYPAKLAHSHIFSLLAKGVSKIFYPCVLDNRKPDKKHSSHYNCPVVASYPEVLRANIEQLQQENITFWHAFLPLDDPKRLSKRLHSELASEDLTVYEVKAAVEAAWQEREAYREDIRRYTRQALQEIEEKKLTGIVLAGRPYHLDPAVNHGLPALLSSFNVVVLSEDALPEPVTAPNLRVVDQWSFHSRLYKAAQYVAEHARLELIQLTSFGCGLDAITADQVAEILRAKGKLFTLLKLDDINNLGAAKIRIRSLLAAAHQVNRPQLSAEKTVPLKRTLFTKTMRSGYTILAPQLSPIHFELFEPAFQSAGYNLEILRDSDAETVETGLRYVNHDACYPAVLVIGQLMQALQSGKYDLQKTAVMMSQTGGCCRATNYLPMLRKALEQAGLSHIPAISLSSGLETTPGFSMSFNLLDRCLKALVYGDLLQQLLLRTRPYEKLQGAAEGAYQACLTLCKEIIRSGSRRDYRESFAQIVRRFDELPCLPRTRPRVGIVGEILVKFHPMANNHLIDFLEKEGAEAVLPDFTSFLLYCAYDKKVRYDLLSGSWMEKLSGLSFIKMIEWYRRDMKKALSDSQHFLSPPSIDTLAEYAKPHLSLGNVSGEGWLLTAEMVELIKQQVHNIVCLQPFACLPNHVTGKGMIKELRRIYHNVNILPIDYDPGASETNQTNRLKLLLASMQRRLALDPPSSSAILPFSHSVDHPLRTC